MPTTDQRATINLWPDAAKRLGIGKTAVYQAAHRGEIPIVRIGGRMLVPVKALERMLEVEKEAHDSNR